MHRPEPARSQGWHRGARGRWTGAQFIRSTYPSYMMQVHAGAKSSPGIPVVEQLPCIASPECLGSELFLIRPQKYDLIRWEERKISYCRLRCVDDFPSALNSTTMLNLQPVVRLNVPMG